MKTWEINDLHYSWNYPQFQLWYLKRLLKALSLIFKWKFYCGILISNKTSCRLIHCVFIRLTRYLFSDWRKAYSKFAKSAYVTSSSCTLYNIHVKDAQGHGYSSHVWPRCMISKGTCNHVKLALSGLLAVSKETKTWLPLVCP